jgi:hypothetical protein
MVVRNEVVIEITKNERVYRFTIPLGSPFGEAYDTAYEVLYKISEMAKESAEKAKAPEEVEG